MHDIVCGDPTAQLISNVRDYIAGRPNSDVHIGLTGGRTGKIITQELIEDCADNPRIHFWFSDERFVARNDVQRNDDNMPQDAKCHIHSIASRDDVSTAQEAATKYSAEIHQGLTTRFCADNTLMDICILSVGPDGHIASLFPHHPALDESLGVVAVTNSPKPPAERVTWTYPTINASRNVWLIASGVEKANAVKQLRAGADLHELPVAGVHGKEETRLYLDAEASSS